MKGPLSGIKVLEFAQIAAGPFAGSLFADLGADVVKVERPDGGDGMRSWPPAIKGEDGKIESGNFVSVNRNKRSITIDVKNPEEMQQHAESFDFILNTVAAPHNLDAFTALLKRDGTMCLVGVPDSPHPSPSVGNLIFKRRALAGSLIGGLRETQEMLDFCAEHGIVAEIETIRAQDIEAAYERMLKSDVKYRFVIDTASM